MTSASQEPCVRNDAAVDTLPHGDSIVISGMAGLYPEAKSVKELSTILYDKVDPIKSSTRSNWNHPEVSKYLGKVSGLNRFDAQFFMVHYRLAAAMDPMSRKILEQTYQAIIDAGVNPQELSGKKVAVYVGASFSENEKIGFYNIISKSGFGVPGNCKSMYANRISYWLNIKGPSFAIDVDSSSGIAAIEQACSAISNGECEAAIVASANICLHPHCSIHLARAMKMSSDGKTKSFDANADGYVQSEAINVLFLQKAKDARRIYAYIKHVKCEFLSLLHEETGPKYGLCRDPITFVQFLQKFYVEAGISPQLVEYVEAVGSAVPDADKFEVETFEQLFCEKKRRPLLIGSVMSNIGNSHAASGISSVTKVLLGYEKGILAGNLHYTTPREDLRALKEDHIRVIKDNCPFGRTYAAINSMSLTGINAHILLHGHNKLKDSDKYKSNLPRLVNVSGRHEAAVESILNELKNNTIDPEQLALLHKIHSNNISGHLARGFIILDTDEQQKTVSLNESIEHYNDVKRPLWFIYSGMGSQWPGMGKELMRIPTFSAAIERCQQVLQPKGIDIVYIITSNEKTIFDNILHSFVGIAAVQIGLTDVLREIGLVPDKIIGHSVGELGCAYADDCLTSEEMILSAYSRGLVSIQTPLKHGSMAAVGLGYKQVIRICPPEIDVACHNGPQSCTISGPADVMLDFVAKLTSDGIFAKEVPCSNIAYHSRYIADAGQELLKYLSDGIKSPKLRSERWISTSVPQANWTTSLAKYCSAEYLTNNLLSPVLFEEASTHIPANAVLVEIAPHGLLQAILKRSLHSTCFNIALTKRHHPDNAFLVLEAIGKLYNQGYSTKVDALYQKVEFPVSAGTPMLSHLVEWSHQEVWDLPLYQLACKKKSALCEFVISITDKEYSFLQGHVMRGTMSYPFASGLVAVWDIFAMIHDTNKNNMSVKFDNVFLHVQPILHEQRQLRLRVSLHRGNGRFEVTDDFCQIMTGSIVNNNEKSKQATEMSHDENKDSVLSSNCIYELLQERDYLYRGEFRSIQSANASFTEAKLVWNNNWATLIDGMLQLNALRREHDGVSQPTHISCLSIDVNKHQKQILNDKTLIKANVSDVLDMTQCGGIVMQYVKFHDLPAISDEIYFDLHVSALERNLTKRSDISNNTQADRKNVVLISKHVGDIDSLQWKQVPELVGIGVKVMVHYAGINIGDILKATGEIPIKQNSEVNRGEYAVDFSGLTMRGDRVMGMVQTGACSSYLFAQPELLWPVPAHWSLQEAATVPFAYTCAFYCLRIKTEIRPGMNILVHGGAGVLGQAAINISLAYGCQVFTTVSNNDKKNFLLKLYPDLKEEHIANSRNDSFMEMVLNETNRRGCDIIICSVKGKEKDSSLKCSAFQGITLDVIQNLTRENFEYGMFNMTKQRSYLVLDFMTIFEKMKERNALQMMVSEGISKGYVRPLTCVTYAPCEVSRAFRLLARSQHFGRVLLNLNNTTITTSPSLECSTDSCHIIIFDQYMIGVHLVNKLIHRGVKKLHLHYDGSSTLVLQHKLSTWWKKNIDVHVSFRNLKDIKMSSIISKASVSGSVEGIYVIVGDTSNNNKEVITTYLTELDLSSRQLCPLLKYFAVISLHDDIGQNICLERMKKGFPATSIYAAVLKTLLNEKDTAVNSTAYYRKLIEEIEQALLSSRLVLVTVLRKIKKPSLRQEIVNITGINFSADVSDTATLTDLGVVKNDLPLLRTLFRDNHSVSLSEEEIARLNLKTINQIDNTNRKIGFKKVAGLETFFSYVDSDELLASTELVSLPTIASIEMINKDIDTNQQSLCIIPGLEGHHERFRTMCERIKLPVFVLQHDLDRPNETIKESALRYTKIMLEKTNLKNVFYLMGYESGILVALEMARIFENSGKTGTVFCIGSAPEDVKLLIEEELKEFETEEQLRNGVARHMIKLMAGGHTNAKIEDILCSTIPWRAKVEACVRTLSGRVSHSAQYAGALIESAFGRIQKVRRFSTTPVSLRSQIVLLRSSQTRQYDPVELQSYSQQPVVVHELSTPLAHVVKDVYCATFINQHLDASILEAYETSNLCIKYDFNSCFMALCSDD